ncbi:MAG: sigma-70 RNA polymerase sigma factor region 4 domain-containing protein [Armatimonadota bacterium]
MRTNLLQYYYGLEAAIRDAEALLGLVRGRIVELEQVLDEGPSQGVARLDGCGGGGGVSDPTPAAAAAKAALWRELGEELQGLRGEQADLQADLYRYRRDRVALGAAVRRLSPDVQEICRLRYEVGRSNVAIGVALSIEETTVRYHLRCAGQALQAAQRSGARWRCTESTSKPLARGCQSAGQTVLSL